MQTLLGPLAAHSAKCIQHRAVLASSTSAPGRHGKESTKLDIEGPKDSLSKPFVLD